jgi:dethiobiotin synthetase
MIGIDRSVFITGTDTGVGKTRVAVALLRELAAAGRRVAAMKPVAAGGLETSHGLRNEDALDLAAAAAVRLPYELVNPCCLPLATSPHLASRAAGRPIDVDALVAGYRQVAARAEIVIVEGAGGWLVPIGEPARPGEAGPTMADLARALGLPVLLVVGIRLGCLNHALLTAEAIRVSGLPLAGWIANVLDPDFPGAGDYVGALEARLPAPRLATFPFDAAAAGPSGL